MPSRWMSSPTERDGPEPEVRRHVVTRVEREREVVQVRGRRRPQLGRRYGNGNVHAGLPGPVEAAGSRRQERQRAARRPTRRRAAAEAGTPPRRFLGRRREGEGRRWRVAACGAAIGALCAADGRLEALPFWLVM